MTTEILKLTEMSSRPVSPEIDVNTMLRRIEGRMIRVKSRSNGGPPGSPAAGDTYIVDTATGVWAAFTAKNIAHYFGGAWEQYAPVEGIRVFVNDEDCAVWYDGSNWNRGEPVLAVTPSAGVLTLNCKTAANFTCTLTSSITSVVLSNASLLTTGRHSRLRIRFTQDGTGGHTVTGWAAAFKWPGGSAPTITAAANAVDELEGYTDNAGTTVRMVLVAQDVK